MRHTTKLFLALWVALVGVTNLSSQTTCGEVDPFWLPPSRTFCVDSAGIATISFKLLNLGAPGNYTVSFPDGATAEYTGIRDTVTVSHQMEFLCSDMPGSPAIPTQLSPFYAYQGELSIVRTDCVDSQGDSPRGSYDFNVIPNPLDRITTSKLRCLQSPFRVDLEAELCQDDLVESYRWYLDGQLIANSNEPELKRLLIRDAGLHVVRVEAITNKLGCGPYFLDKEIIITEAPSLDVDFLVDSSTLCQPVVSVATLTTASNVIDFAWSSDSPDVTFSDSTAAAPLITIDNTQGDSRVITVVANSESCGQVSDSFTLTTYNNQEIRVKTDLSTCTNELYQICSELAETLAVATIRWVDADASTRIQDAETVCPQLEFTKPGLHTLTATGIDVCNRPFSLDVSVWVRANTPLRFETTAIDTICDREEAIDLADYIAPWQNVATITGPGVVTGGYFDPSGLMGDVQITVTDSCGDSNSFSIHVLRQGSFAGGEPILCQGEVLDLTTLQPGTYRGSGVEGNVFDSRGLEPGLYEIEYASEAYCGGSGRLTITVQPPPRADFSIASPGCPGGDPGTLFAAGQSIRLVNLSVSEVHCYSVVETGTERCDTEAAEFTFPVAGYYTLQQVVGARGTGCTDTLRRVIEVREAFSPEFAYEVQEDGCDSLTISFDARQLPESVVPGWSLSNGQVLQAKRASIKMARPLQEQWLSVAVNASNGCFEFQDTFTFELPRRFQVAFGILNDNNTVCSGDTVYLKNNSVNADDLLISYPDGSTDTNIPDFLVLTNDTEEVLSYPIVLSGHSDGCSAQVVTDTVYVLPVATRAGFNLAYADNCSSAEVSLVNLSTTGSSGRVFWGDGSTPQWVGVGDTIHHRFRTSRDTTVTIALEATLCGTDVFRSDYTVRSVPDPAFSLIQSPSRCVGDTLRFLPASTVAGHSLDWDFGDGYFSQHNRPFHVYEAPGTYPVILEVTTAYGCTAADTNWVTVGQYSGPALAATIPDAACVGGPFPVKVHAPTTGVSYIYDTDRRAASALEEPFSTVGEFPFTLSSVDGAGCRADTTVTVTVHPALSVAIVPDGRDTTVELGNSINLSFSASPHRPLDSIVWSGSGVVAPFGNETKITPIDDELYRLDVIDLYGCRASDSVMVRVRADYRDRVYSANVFTPNGDGVNESFALQVKPNTVKSISSMRIRSRWGAIMYECEECEPANGTGGWDGFFDGVPAKTGVYLWSATVEFVDGTRQMFTGDVTLLR